MNSLKKLTPKDLNPGSSFRERGGLQLAKGCHRSDPPLSLGEGVSFLGVVPHISFFLIFLFSSFLHPSPLHAQALLYVENEIINVGEVQYQQPKTATFRLTNRGSKPLVILDIHASCGCTKVTWPDSPVAPGDKADIAVTYDARMLGSFQKELEVYTSASDTPLYLTLQGRVVDTFSADVHDDFPVDLGTVRLSTNVVEFDDVNSGDAPEATLQVLNTSKSPYKPELMHLPPYLTARYLPERLAGGRVGRIVLRLDSEKLKSHGLTQTTVYLARRMGDKVGGDNEIAISALLLPPFAHLSPQQIQTAPHIHLSADSVDFSALAGKKKLTHTLTVSNTGQRPLTVSRLQVYGKALSVSLSDRVIQPGQQARLKITATSAYLSRQKHTPRVLIICDDPQQPKTILHAILPPTK